MNLSGIFSSFAWLFILTVSASNVDHRSIRAHQMLLDNLGKFYRQSPAVFQKPKSQPVLESFELSNHILTLISDSYMDPNTLRSLGQTSKQFEQLRLDIIYRRLSSFNKYFVFEDHWFNEVMFMMISDNFPSHINLDSLEIHDHVELMTQKYFLINKKTRRSFPNYIELAILSFFHQTVYGLDAVVPLPSMSIFSLATKSQKHNIPTAIAFRLKEYYQILNKFGVKTPVIDIIEFFSQKPTELEQLAYISRYADFNPTDDIKKLEDILTFRDTENTSFDQTMQICLFDNLLTGEITGHRAKIFLNLIPRSPSYPVNILKKIKWNHDLLQFTQIIFNRNNRAGFYRDLHRMSGIGTFDAISYVWSCNLMTPFSIEEIQKFPDFDARKIFYEVSRSHMPFLIQTDILIKIIQSGTLKLDEYHPNFLFDCLKMPLSSIYELMLTLSSQLVNLVDYHGLGKNGRFFSDLTKNQFDVTLATQFRWNNPLGPILFSPSVSTLSKAKFVVKFNLNVAYTFDDDFSKFSCGILKASLLEVLIGETLTFKRILQIINDYTLNKLYGLEEPQDFEDLNPETYPTFSLTEYFKNPNSIQ